MDRPRVWKGHRPRPDGPQCPSRFPVLALMHPREQARAVVLLLAIGLLLWGVVVWAAGMPIWGATTMALSLLLVPAVRKWRTDLHRYGRTTMVLSILLVMQGFHSVEHTAQWIQLHVLHWSPLRSSGLISAANAEWVHFIWNWAVVAAIVYLLCGGVRNFWAWLLLGWAFAHALEHAYLLARYLEMRRELGLLGVPSVSAQGLPGILGRDGWLARSPTTQSTFFCRMPGVTTANRVDVHFWWNSGEIVLLVMAAHKYLRGRLHGPSRPSTLL